MANTSKAKKANPLFWVGAIALLLSIIFWFVAIPFNKKVGVDDWGVAPGFWWIWKVIFGGASGYVDGMGFLIIILAVVGIGIGIVSLVAFFMTKKKSELINFCIAVVAAFAAAYMLVTIQVGLHFHAIGPRRFLLASGCLGTVILVLIIIAITIAASVAANNVPVAEAAEKPAEVDEEKVREIVRDELSKQPKEEKEEGVTEEKVNEIVDDKTLKEERVREIVREELDKEEEKPAEEEAPVEEEKVEEPVAEEPDEAEGEETEEGEDGEVEVDAFGHLHARRRASFETKLKNSEYELRHKYYDLRDYIKSYGVNNRISIPGDTFSLHREKLAFITISGKHIKACFALDPDDYKDSTIPCDRNTSKRFEDLPLAFKIKSDLSFRRALKLVDDMMAKKGYTKPEDKSAK